LKSAGASTEGDFRAVEVRLDLGVEDEHKRATSAAEHVGQRAFEEGEGTFLLGDLLDAVDCAGVLDVSTLAARLHHQASADGVEGVGNDASTDGHDLGEEEQSDGGCFLHVGEEDGLAGVEAAEVGGAVSDDTNHGDTEALVKAGGSVSNGDLLEAINQTSELTGLATADVSSQAGTGEVEGIDDAEGGRASSTTGSAVADKELDGFLLGVEGAENLLVNVFKCKVEGLGGEVPNHVGQVASPEGGKSLLGVNSLETVTNTSVLLHVSGRGLTSLGGLLAHGVLDLEQEFDSLDGGDGGLGDGGRNTTDHKVSEEALLLWRAHLLI